MGEGRFYITEQITIKYGDRAYKEKWVITYMARERERLRYREDKARSIIAWNSGHGSMNIIYTYTCTSFTYIHAYT